MKQGIKIQVLRGESGSGSNLHRASKQSFCKLKPGETTIPPTCAFLAV